MAKSNGIKDLKQAAKLLNKHAPDGEKLAYINKKEAELLRAHGGSGIITLQGVPSYWTFPSWVPVVGDKSLGEVAGDVWNWGKDIYRDKPRRDDDGEIIYDKKGNPVIQKGRSIVDDAMSVWVGLEAKKNQEGLNEHEQKIYNDLKSQMAAAEREFAVNVAGGPSVTDVPTKIEDVASFTDVTLPALKTTAVAEGGRIGYNLGGIGAMDPRIGYQMGSPHGQVIPTFSEGVQQMYESGPGGVNQITDEEFYQNIKPIGTLEQDISGKPQLNRDDLISQKVSDNFELLRGMRDRGMIDVTLTDEELLRTAWRNVKGNYLDEDRKQYKPENLALAHGGRIGAKEGGIMPLLNLGGMEKDYRQDGGFVPIGRREKADDVPARLSKNEFVFTADAVRNAGGGDIDKGAQRMYNVMKNLEAGGEISEQSQGQV